MAEQKRLKTTRAASNSVFSSRPATAEIWGKVMRTLPQSATVAAMDAADAPRPSWARPFSPRMT